MFLDLIEVWTAWDYETKAAQTFKRQVFINTRHVMLMRPTLEKSDTYKIGARTSIVMSDGVVMAVTEPLETILSRKAGL